jgi:hypothetical protein
MDVRRAPSSELRALGIKLPAPGAAFESLGLKAGCESLHLCHGECAVAGAAAASGQRPRSRDGVAVRCAGERKRIAGGRS